MSKPKIKSAAPASKNTTVGSQFPVTGTGEAEALATGDGETRGDAFGVAETDAEGEGEGDGLIDAEGVAACNTWVPLFKIVNVWETTNGLLFLSNEAAVIE